jgi:transcriptional regulator GlxA family with amidase domain
MDGRIFDLLDDLLEDLKHDWTVEEMAVRGGLSISHFPFVFRTHIHYSPGAYLKKIRLESANVFSKGYTIGTVQLAYPQIDT